MKIKKGFVLRSVGGENVVVPSGEMSKTFRGMITLNNTGAFLWEYFLQEHTQEEAIEAVLAEFEATREIVEIDVARFVKVLLDNGFFE